MAAQLRMLSDIHGLPIVVVNQVSDFIERDNADQTIVKPSYLYQWGEETSGRRVIPAMGLSWAQCVNARLFLTRKNELHLHRTRRFLTLSLSPLAPASAVEFEVYNEGVRGVGEQLELIAHVPLMPLVHTVSQPFRHPLRVLQPRASPSPPPTSTSTSTYAHTTVPIPKQVVPLSPAAQLARAQHSPFLKDPTSKLSTPLSSPPTNYAHVQFSDPDMMMAYGDENVQPVMPALYSGSPQLHR